MQRILLFLYSLRVFIIFIALETIAIWLIVSYNSPQGAVFFNSSNHITGNFLETRENVTGYFTLGIANEGLAEKNAELLTRLEYLTHPRDSAYIDLDSAFASAHEFRSAKVINNSIRFNQNHITLNKGRRHGVREGMGVFNEQGVIGRVKGVTNNFSTVISLLHTELLLSSKIKASDVFGSTKWDGKNPTQAKLLYVPRHVRVNKGDTVITSGYNAIFPEGINIGIVDEVGSGPETNYLDITINLTTDFSRLTFVYLVENVMQVELDSLNRASEIINE
ncbi:rod shape-determining protein MreC [Anditalea andensis]|uniref:Cell shape-determining protein MreC n=1 Tax=Anditalea andensis TaxID=1048983 RepID=A0A074KXV8_9BACT|nr:rod shape-determining protein MreC [Anditalea andensis]KEO73040.1 rod shape-determining protein MreC [Anditalea andensis]